MRPYFGGPSWSWRFCWTLPRCCCSWQRRGRERRRVRQAGWGYTTPSSPVGKTLWIASAAIALLILGAKGINMLVHHDTSAAMPGTSWSLTPK
jgi:hypothetical protein